MQLRHGTSGASYYPLTRPTASTLEKATEPWARLSDLSCGAFERLFFECYARAPRGDGAVTMLGPWQG